MCGLFAYVQQMKSVGHILAIVAMLFCVGITESFAYTLNEVAATERCDDSRESEDFRLSSSSIKVSKSVFVVARRDAHSLSTKYITSDYSLTPSLSRFLYLRIRVLRN